MSEAVVPNGGYPTFSDFFTRTLAPGARPVDSTRGALVSPCDGVVQAVGDLRDSRFEVKGKHWGLTELLGRPGWWDSKGDGGYMVIYLSPADYHRVHSPTSGRIEDVWRLDGSCMPVNRIGQILAPWAIVQNERVVYDLDSAEGPLTVVMVGALAVRAIEVTVGGFNGDGFVRGSDEITIERGEEIGVFNLGSTVVLLWQGGSQVDVRLGERVNVGQRVAVRDSL